MTSIYSSTRLKVVADTPLGRAIGQAYPNGFEPLEGHATYNPATGGQDMYYLIAPCADSLGLGWEQKRLMRSLSTPAFVAMSWNAYGTLWVPAAWCEEVEQ